MCSGTRQTYATNLTFNTHLEHVKILKSEGETKKCLCFWHYPSPCPLLQKFQLPLCNFEKVSLVSWHINSYILNGSHAVFRGSVLACQMLKICLVISASKVILFIWWWTLKSPSFQPGSAYKLSNSLQFYFSRTEIFPLVLTASKQTGKMSQWSNIQKDEWVEWTISIFHNSNAEIHYAVPQLLKMMPLV